MSSSKVLTVFLFLATVGMLLTLEGCGGGSAGTGFDTQGRNLTIEGALLSNENEPLSGVIVTVVNTGSSTVTDASGVFTLTTSQLSGDAELSFQKGEESGSTTVPVTEEATSVQIVVTLTPELANVNESTYTMTSTIGGDCSPFFSKETPIIQTGATPDGIECSAAVQVSIADSPATGIPFAVQYRSCDSDSPWITLALGETNSKDNPGTGLVSFPFVDDSAHCTYRIVAPFNIDGAALVAKEIQTLTFLSAKKVATNNFRATSELFGTSIKLVDF